MALNLGKAFKKAGIATIAAKTKLWPAEPTTLVAEDLAFGEDKKTKESLTLYVKEYEDGTLSPFVVFRDKTGSRSIGFAPGQVNPSEWEYDAETGLVSEEDADFSINIGIVEALRDDDELMVRDRNGDKVPVTEGLKVPKVYVA